MEAQCYTAPTGQQLRSSVCIKAERFVHTSGSQNQAWFLGNIKPLHHPNIEASRKNAVALGRVEDPQPATAPEARRGRDEVCSTGGVRVDGS